MKTIFTFLIGCVVGAIVWSASGPFMEGVAIGMERQRAAQQTFTSPGADASQAAPASRSFSGTHFVMIEGVAPTFILADICTVMDTAPEPSRLASRGGSVGESLALARMGNTLVPSRQKIVIANTNITRRLRVGDYVKIEAVDDGIAEFTDAPSLPKVSVSIARVVTKYGEDPSTVKPRKKGEPDIRSSRLP